MSVLSRHEGIPILASQQAEYRVVLSPGVHLVTPRIRVVSTHFAIVILWERFIGPRGS